MSKIADKCPKCGEGSPHHMSIGGTAPDGTCVHTAIIACDHSDCDFQVEADSHSGLFAYQDALAKWKEAEE